MENDCISRQDVIDALENIDCSDGIGINALKCDVVEDAINAINTLPSAQPTHNNASNALKSLDCISREEAIDDLHGKDPSQIWDTADIEVWLNSLPPAQPEERALHESCTDCPLYDKDRHCCPRFNKVIPETLREVMAERR